MFKNPFREFVLLLFFSHHRWIDDYRLYLTFAPHFAAELFVNGEIVQRSPERQRRVEPQPQRAQDRPRYNDRTRYARRRENMR